MNKKVNKKYNDEARSCCDPGAALHNKSDPFSSSFTPGNTAETKEEQFVQIARMLFNRGLITGVDGAMAWRIADQTILVSPMRRSLGFLTAGDVAQVSLDGKYQNRIVPGMSVEFLIKIFRQNLDVGAIIQAHPKFGSVLGLAQDSLPLSLLPDLQQHIGQIKSIEFQIHWTEELLRRLQARNRSRGVFLIENYGVLVFAEDLLTAALTLDSLEHYLEIIYYSLHEGGKGRNISRFEVAAR